MDAQKLEYKGLTAILIVLVVCNVPTGQSEHAGVPATLDCQARLNSGVSVDARGYATGRTGELYVVEQILNANPTGRITRLNTNCSVQWTHTIATGEFVNLAPPTITAGCAFNAFNYCRYFGAAVDAAGDFVTVLELFNTINTPDQTFWLVKYDGLSGDRIAISPDLEAIVGTVQPEDRGLDAIRVSDTEVAYMFQQEAAGKVHRFSDDLQTKTWTANIAGAFNIRADAQTDVAYVSKDLGAGLFSFSRLDQTTGTVLHTSALSIQGSRGYTPIASLTTNKAFVMIESGTTLDYAVLDRDTFATITAAQPVTPSQVTSGGTPYNTDVQGFDLDAVDNILVCGPLAAGAQPAFVGRIDTSLTTLAWDTILTPIGATTPVSEYCHFDYTSGFWSTGYGTYGATQNTWAAHYIGGGFSQPPAPALVTPPGGGGTPTEGPRIVRLIQTRTAEAWGVSQEAAGWVIGTIFFAYAIYHLGKRAPLITATMILLISIVLVFIELWPSWILLLEGFLIVVFAGVALFEKGDSGTE